MKAAIGIFGFLAEIHEAESIKSCIRNALPDCLQTIDIFYFGPNVLHEKDLNKLDSSKIELNFKNANLGNIYFKWFDYDPSIFIRICKKHNFPIIADTGIYPYRLLSMFYNIKGTIDMIQSSNINYDYVILLRNDYIKYIKKYDDLFSKNILSGLYIFRNDGHAEDRVIYGTPDYIFELAKIYEEIPSILKKDLKLAFGEGLLRDFAVKNIDSSKLFTQKGIQPLGVPILNKEFKRTEQMKMIVEKFYKECN